MWDKENLLFIVIGIVLAGIGGIVVGLLNQRLLKKKLLKINEKEVKHLTEKMKNTSQKCYFTVRNQDSLEDDNDADFEDIFLLTFKENLKDGNFLVLEPSIPIANSIWLQVAYRKQQFNIEIGFLIDIESLEYGYYLYQTTFLEKIEQIFEDYYFNHKLPDTTNWTKTDLL